MAKNLRRRKQWDPVQPLMGRVSCGRFRPHPRGSMFRGENKTSEADTGSDDDNVTKLGSTHGEHRPRRGVSVHAPVCVVGGEGYGTTELGVSTLPESAPVDGAVARSTVRPSKGTWVAGMPRPLPSNPTAAAAIDARSVRRRFRGRGDGDGAAADPHARGEEGWLDGRSGWIRSGARTGTDGRGG